MFPSTFFPLFPVPIHAEQVWKKHNGWMEVFFCFQFFFFLRHYGLFCVTFQSVPTDINLHSFTSFATGLKVFFLPLPHLILFQDWKVKISAMRITVSCACRSTFQLGTRPSAAGSRPRRKQERSMQRLPFPRSRLKLSSSGLPQRMFCWGSTASNLLPKIAELQTVCFHSR